MRALARSWVVFLIAVAVGGIGAVKAEDQSQSDGAQPNQSSVERPSSRLQIGDKIKIAFYEMVDLTRSGQGGVDRAESDGALRTFYQRMDLSGEYTIDQDGSISLPLLGRFVVEGQSGDQVRVDLAAAFTSVIGRTANLELRLLERAPIYVVGPVKAPGAYKYVPGMIVLHAIALAGGLDAGNTATMVDSAREVERLRIRSLEINQLLARRARLEAERDGASDLTVPLQLVGSVSDDPTHSAIGTELALFRADKVRREQKREEIAQRMALTGREIEAIKRKLEQFEAQKNLRMERLHDLQKLKDQGWASSNSIMTLRTELSDLEAHRQDQLIALLQAQARLGEAGEAAARLCPDETAETTRDLAQVNKELAIAQEAMNSAQAIATMLYRPAAEADQPYEIVRQSKDGARTIKAVETSLLLPGDVLKVLSGSALVAPGELLSKIPQTRLTAAQFHNAH